MLFFSLRKNLMYHPHTLQFFLPSLFLFCFPLPLLLLTNALTPTQKKKSECVHGHYTHIHRHTQVLTSHPQQICWWLCTQIKLTTSSVRSLRDQAELLSSLLPAISSTKSRREINDLSECQCGVGLGLIHKHKAHSQKKGTPPLSVEWCCGVDVITHMQPQLNTSRPFTYFQRWRRKCKFWVVLKVVSKALRYVTADAKYTLDERFGQSYVPCGYFRLLVLFCLFFSNL